MAPTRSQHPIRGSFLDPRATYHFGVDIAVRDDRPERGHPPGRTHRVYAVESGVVSGVVDVSGSPCTDRHLDVGRFAYWHVDAVVRAGQRISRGRMIGWTCLNTWHVHFAERGLAGWVNPLRAGSVLSPYKDRSAPKVHAIRFFTPAMPRWTASVYPSAGRQLARDALRGVVDVRAWVTDPQSFRGWMLNELAILYTDLHPYRLHLRVQRLRDGAVVVNRDVFRALYFPPVPINWHYAPGTTVTFVNDCLSRRAHLRPAGCGSVFWFRAFASVDSPYWDTRRFRNGWYRISVAAWDTRGNRDAASIRARIRN